MESDEPNLALNELYAALQRAWTHFKKQKDRINFGSTTKEIDDDGSPGLVLLARSAINGFLKIILFGMKDNYPLWQWSGDTGLTLDGMLNDAKKCGANYRAGH